MSKIQTSSDPAKAARARLRHVVSRGAAFGLGLLLAAYFATTAEAVQITEYSLPAGSKPVEIARGPDGNMWFTDGGTNTIGRITMDGTVTEFGLGITPKAQLVGIAAGPEGNLWFTERSGHKLGRITTSGAITEFSSGLTGSPDIFGVTPGPGGMWFTETFNARIGVIDTSTGAIKEFPVPAGVYTQIVQGPDGNLWATNVERATILRLTPTGTATAFGPLPSSDCAVGATTPCPYPETIAVGPDGNLWFDETRGNVIGRITTAGGISGFGGGLTHGAAVGALSAGPEGNVWFTEAANNDVGRITPSGTITEFGAGISEHASPRGIALGPDENLWVTEPGVGKIARVIPDVPPNVVTGALAAVGQRKAGVTGSVRPRGADTSYYFQYGTDTSYGRSTAATGVGSGDSPVPVGTELANLKPGQWYHYRLVATNANGTSYGQDASFLTKAKKHHRKPKPKSVVPPFEMYVEGFVNKKRLLHLTKIVVIRLQSGERVSFRCGKCHGSPSHGLHHSAKSKVSFGGLDLTLSGHSRIEITVAKKKKGRRVRTYSFRISTRRAEQRFESERCFVAGRHKPVPCSSKHHHHHHHHGGK